MNKLNLNALSVQEMTVAEMQQVDGGLAWIPFVIGVFAGGLLYDVLFNPSDAVAAFKEGIKAGLK